MLDVILDTKKSFDINIQPKEVESVKTNKELNTPKPFTHEDLKTTKTMVEILNTIPDSELKFGFSEEGKMGIVKVFEKETERLIRQFPSEEFFNRLTYFRDNILPGLLMVEKV